MYSFFKNMPMYLQVSTYIKEVFDKETSITTFHIFSDILKLMVDGAIIHEKC